MRKRTNIPRIAIGPITNSPSWAWVGQETVSELSKYYEIVQYKDFQLPLNDVDLILIIKKLPSLTFVNSAKAQGIKLIYCPIDFFEREEDIHLNSKIFSSFDLVLSHCERLNPYFSQYCPTDFIDHHAKYTLPQMAQYKEKGFVLWIGGYQFVPYLMKWLSIHPIKEHKVKILSDYTNKRAITRANDISKTLRIKINMRKLDLYDWSEKLQEQMMNEAKAAIDIKGDNSFQQFNKPPTKAQKYISSGLPLAMNRTSYSSEYFRARDFTICSPTEQDTWFSKQYYDQTVNYGTKLKEYLSLYNIGIRYKNYIDLCLKE